MTTYGTSYAAPCGFPLRGNAISAFLRNCTPPAPARGIPLDPFCVCVLLGDFLLLLRFAQGACVSFGAEAPWEEAGRRPPAAKGRRPLDPCQRDMSLWNPIFASRCSIENIDGRKRVGASTLAPASYWVKVSSLPHANSHTKSAKRTWRSREHVPRQSPMGLPQIRPCGSPSV